MYGFFRLVRPLVLLLMFDNMYIVEMLDVSFLFSEKIYSSYYLPT
jgi:hypothetical protein